MITALDRTESSYSCCHGLHCNKYPNWSILYVLFGKGHTDNSADEIHSFIEREKNVSVYSPRDWVVLMRQIKTKNVTINAKLPDHSRFLDVKGYAQQFPNFHKDENRTPVLNWKTVQTLMDRKSNPYILFFKNEYNQPEFQQINLLQRGCNRNKVIDENSIITNLKRLYSSKLPISTDKYNDLMKYVNCVLSQMINMRSTSNTPQKMKFSVNDFFSKCDQIRSFLRIWSHLLEKSLMETSFFMQCNYQTATKNKHFVPRKKAERFIYIVLARTIHIWKMSCIPVFW